MSGNVMDPPEGIAVAGPRTYADGAEAWSGTASARLADSLREVAAGLAEAGEPSPAEAIGLRCVACRERVPLGCVEVAGEQGLSYTCPSCGKRIEFAPVSTLARRREALVAERELLARERQRLWEEREALMDK